jgi:hypothetical protein
MKKDSTLICKCCGKEFPQKRQPKIYCSRACAIKRVGIPRIIGKEQRKELRKQGLWYTENQVPLGDLVDYNE